ncbi:MAG: phosphoribosylaminoimidazolesuccinocarboxamide synthase [Thermodesulfobacteriota bacterium]
MNTAPLRETSFPDLALVHRGKVRDLYAVDGQLLMVATDRISAFDVVMDDPIPDKGRVLTQISLFWFDYLRDIIDNHLVNAEPAAYPAACHPYREQLAGRSMLVKRCQPLPLECIVRGYLAGSGWKEYQRQGSVCGIPLPAGLRESEQLPQPIFTPSTKAAIGQHDENITLAAAGQLLGEEVVAQVASVAIRLYQKAADYARGRGIIIADTKFEMGWHNGRLILIDEVLTPDSSRFWPADDYEPGRAQRSFDKQFLRDYLAGLDWPQTPPPPRLPAEIVARTRERYLEALKRLAG